MRQKREKRAEAIRTAAKVSDVQKAVASASVSVPVPGSENRRLWRATIIVATAVAIAGSSIFLWRASLAQSSAQSNTQSSAQSRTPAEARGSDAPSAKSAPFAGNFADLPAGLSPEPAAALNSAITQLESALSSFPGRDPEDILREASRINRACRLQWNDGRPSLVFGGSPQANSLSSTITQCSEAVKKLH